jgi:hypothetical protein
MEAMLWWWWTMLVTPLCDWTMGKEYIVRLIHRAHCKVGVDHASQSIVWWPNWQWFISAMRRSPLCYTSIEAMVLCIEVVDHVSLLCDGAISAVVYMDYEQVSTVCRYNAQWCKMLCNEHQHCVHRLFVAGNTMVLLNYWLHWMVGKHYYLRQLAKQWWG